MHPNYDLSERGKSKGENNTCKLQMPRKSKIFESD
jgi:hypothetical protein